MILTAYYIPILFLIAILFLLLILNLVIMFFGVKTVSIQIFRETKAGKGKKQPLLRESDIE